MRKYGTHLGVDGRLTKLHRAPKIDLGNVVFNHANRFRIRKCYSDIFLSSRIRGLPRGS